MKAKCELCGSEEHHVLFKGRDVLYGQAVQATFIKCDQCGLVYVWPQPTRTLDFYPEGYGPHVGQCHSDDIAFSAGHRRGLVRKAKLISQFGPGLLLDIGCGAGEFLDTVHQLDCRPVLGTDISAQAARAAHEHFGLRVWVGDVPRLSLPSESVSIITLWHVLEHLPHPSDALSDIARALRHDGILVLACPIVDSWEARLFGQYWSGYDVPRHLYAYSRETLLGMLQESGFHASEVRGVVLGFNSARLSAALWLKRFAVCRQHPRVMRLAAALLGGCTTLVFELLSLLLGNRRSVAVFVARKQTGIR